VAGVILTIRKMTHTVYSYDCLMLAIIVTLTQTTELEQRTVPKTCVAYWLAIG